MGDSISSIDETKLVEELRSGDALAVEELYCAYRDKIHALVFNQIGKEGSAAEDIVQETFLAALKSMDKFRGDSQLYTWLCGIAYHKIGDFRRRQAPMAKQGAPLLNLETAGPEQIEDTEPMVSSVMESEETRHEIQQALVTLPVDYRRVLIFKYIEEMPVSEISQVMGRSPKSIEGLLSRARKALRVSLLEEDNGD